MTDGLDDPWFCRACKAEFRAGELRSRGSEPAGQVHCPKCDSLRVYEYEVGDDIDWPTEH
jgi:hypothetical protein